MNLFIQQLFESPRYFFAITLLVVFSICVHEFCHAYAALRQGDATAAERGHLTLNPLRQMGLFSLLMLALLGIAWGQVPVNPARMRHRYSPALVAFAGPAANLGLWLIFLLLMLLTARLAPEQEFALRILLQISVLNLVLFFLNLLPVPGLDGWAILDCFFPKIRLSGSEVTRGAVVILIFVLLWQIKWLFVAAGWLTLVVAELLVPLFQG